VAGELAPPERHPPPPVHLAQGFQLQCGNRPADRLTQCHSLESLTGF